jgi:hypothetical protein
VSRRVERPSKALRHIALSFDITLRSGTFV